MRRDEQQREGTPKASLEREIGDSQQVVDLGRHRIVGACLAEEISAKGAS